MSNEVKQCKFCGSDMPKKASVCPNCKKEQFKHKKLVIAVCVILCIGVIGSLGGNSSNQAPNDDGVVVKNTKDSSSTAKTEETKTKEESKTTEEQTDATSNIVEVGDTYEKSGHSITFVSADDYISNNTFIKPEDGKKFIEVVWKCKNTDKSDWFVSFGMDTETYADNQSIEFNIWKGTYDSSATLSTGREATISYLLEVPEETKTVELEYSSSFWNSSKVVFKVR